MALVTGDMLVGGVLESGDMFDGAPVFSSPSIVNANNWGPVQYQAVVTPSDAVVTLVAPVLGVSWNQGTKIATLTPAEPGSFQFTLRATKDGVSTDLTVSVVVDGRPVFFNPATLAVQAGAIAPVVIEAADPEGATLTLSALSVPNGLVFTPNPVPQNTGNGLVYTGTLSGSVIGGVHSATFRAIAANGGGQTDFTMTITASTVANQAPVISSGNALAVVQGQTATRNITAADPNGDAIVLSLSTAHNWIVLQGTQVIASPGYLVPPGVYQAVVSATDGQASVNQTLYITVQAANTGEEFPSVIGSSITAPEWRIVVVPRSGGFAPRVFTHHPEDQTSYGVDFSAWGDELTTFRVNSHGLAVMDHQLSAAVCQFTLAGGVSGNSYLVEVEGVFEDGQEKRWGFYVVVTDFQ